MHVIPLLISLYFYLFDFQYQVFIDANRFTKFFQTPWPRAFSFSVLEVSIFYICE